MATTNYISMATELGLRGGVVGREFRALCPFHNDRSPSFSLNTSTGLSICFKGCFQGDFPHLVSTLLGIPHGDALLWIGRRENAEEVGTLHRWLGQKLTHAPTTLFEDKDWHYKIQALAHYESLKANFMPEWFIDRGFSWRTIGAFGVRYDPVDAVVIPFLDLNGEMQGTITRYHSPNMPKYINSLGLERAAHLFGKISRNSNLIILVEGALDAMWCWQAGLNAGALLSTQLSVTQIELLRELKYGEIVLGLDADNAGRVAEARIIRQLTDKHWLLKQIKRITWPKGKKDAQECTIQELQNAFIARGDAIEFTRTSPA